MNRDTYYALCHEARFAKWAEKERKRKRRALKAAHKAWLVNRALSVVIADNLAVYAKAQRMAAIFG